MPLAPGQSVAEHTVTINLDGVVAPLHAAVGRALHVTAFGLSAAEAISSMPEGLRANAISLQFPSPFKNVNHARDEFRAWVVMSALRELTEVVGTTLEEARVAAAAYKLFQGGRVATVAEFQAQVEDRRQAFHRLGLPDKLERLRSEFGVGLVPETAAHILSITVARNCLVHRSGRVGPRDVNEGNLLRVRWQRPSLVALSATGEQREISIGATVAGGEGIGMRTFEAEREFAMGETVQFDASDLTNICWTLYVFGAQLVSNVRDFGVACGVVLAPTEPAPDPGGAVE